jgi:hypothetical protein
MHWAGYWVWVYGSASTVFANPPLDGYWVADYVASGQPFMYDHLHVKSTQYTNNLRTGGKYDSSTLIDRVWKDKHHWWV